MKLASLSIWIGLTLVLGSLTALGNPPVVPPPCPVGWSDLKTRTTQPRAANLPAPNFDMGRDSAMLAADPFRPLEAKLLEKAGLTIYPDRNKPDPDRPAAQFEDWAKDLDDYLKENESNPALQDLVQKFVVDYVNHPTGEHLPGDTAWTVPRHVDNFREAYSLPLAYDRQGNILLMKESNQPSHNGPKNLSAEALAQEATMMSQVIGNLKNNMGFVKVIQDRTYEGDRALAKIVNLRRQYLTLRLLEQGAVYAKESEKP